MQSASTRGVFTINKDKSTLIPLLARTQPHILDRISSLLLNAGRDFVWNFATAPLNCNRKGGVHILHSKLTRAISAFPAIALSTVHHTTTLKTNLNSKVKHNSIKLWSFKNGDGNENVKKKKKKTIGLTTKTTTLHVHYTFWYISLPSLYD